MMKAAAPLASLAAMLLFAAPSLAEAPRFTATCPKGITVKSSGNDKIRINREKATVQTFSDRSWEARGKTVNIIIALDGSKLTVSYSGSSGNGACRVTSSTTGSGTRHNDVPKKDQKACRAAVADKAGKVDITVLEVHSAPAGNTVMLSAGKAKWKCIVKSGKVTEAVTLTEGATP